MNKKKKIVVLLVGIVVLIIIAGIYIFYKVYTDGKAEELRKDLSKEYPIIFSADLYNGGKGTYRYYPVDGKMEKISDYIITYPAYNDDRQKLLGFVWEGEYNGLVELDLTNNSIIQVASLDEINSCMEKIGNDTIDIEDIETQYIRSPRYYDDGYTFYFSGNIYLLHKNQETWEIETIISSKKEIYNYYIDSHNKALIEVSCSYNEECMSKVLEYNIHKRKKKELLNNNSEDGSDDDGLIDVSKDGKLIAYYEKKHIFVYNRKTDEKKYVARPNLCDSYLFDLKFSQDNRYIFYTIGEVDLFSSDYNYNFYVVDTESKTKIRLKRWEHYEDFYGFEW